MKVVLASALILDPNSPHNGQRADILVEDGKITAIGKNLKGDRTISSGNLCVSPGWLDLQADFCDPGNEQKETIASGAAAAAAGGFTGVLVMPSTHPPVQSKSEVEYLLRKAQGLAVDIYPAGALSQQLEGKDMAELYDMHLAGAKAFTDGHKAVHNAGLLVRTLMYSRNFNGKIFVHCDEKSISLDGKMNEGPMSTALGLKGIPALAEELMVARNIYLCEYAGAPLHFMNISTARSAELIRAAKKQGLPVTAAVNACNLAWDDSALEEFDSNLKVSPPLRSKEDIAALITALADGTIDAITSDHRPEDPESKVVEFDLAAFGMIGLETAFALARTAVPQLPVEKLAAIFSAAPRRLLGLDAPVLKEGEPANLTAFDPDLEWTFTEKDIRSLSRNTPAIGKKLKGKPLAIINHGQLIAN